MKSNRLGVWEPNPASKSEIVHAKNNKFTLLGFGIVTET